MNFINMVEKESEITKILRVQFMNIDTEDEDDYRDARGLVD